MRITFRYLLLLTVFGLSSCKKTFLDTLPSTAVVVPATLADYQHLLDNTAVTTGTAAGRGIGR